MSPDSENSDVTRMIILGPSAQINQAELVQKLHMLELPLTIKSTCYGAIVHGPEDVVNDAIERIRKLDPNNIFTKDRGFPPGDPRRCRAKRGAAREGFHQLEKEFELLESVSQALENPREVHVEKPCPIDPEILKKLIKECENE
jgi:putative methanogenesis marker protein 6